MSQSYLKAQALFERELDEEYMSDSSIEGEIKATKLYNHACTLALVGESEKGLDALIKALLGLISFRVRSGLGSAP